MNIINRPYYIEKIKPYIDKGLIKVLTGQRRVGKSYVMLQLMNYIQDIEPEANIIWINKEKTAFNFIVDDITFNEYVNNKLDKSRKNYLFVDEIQDIINFEKVLRSLQADNECDIFCTGSNAKLLSGELSTYLSGRYLEFHIHSLSYEEFLVFHKLEDTDEALIKYMTFGGLPYLIHLNLQEDLSLEYLRNIYSTILLKDIIARENIRNVVFLENLSAYLADSVGSLFSALNISKYLKSQRQSMSHSAILNYLRLLSNAYIINKVQRYDIRGKRVFELNEKYYFEDIGLRNVLAGINLNKDIQKIMENAVFLHLKMLGYTVYIGKYDEYEIDFMAQKNNEQVYIQVAYLLSDETTKKREIGNLQLINDNYPKYLVTLDPFNTGSNYEGILHVHLRSFLRMHNF